MVSVISVNSTLISSRINLLKPQEENIEAKRLDLR